jgi:hypothetical protein
MSNMSYCAFQNTLPDLQDCYDKLADAGGVEYVEGEDERIAAKRLIDVCRNIVDDFDEDSEED